MKGYACEENFRVVVSRLDAGGIAAIRDAHYAGPTGTRPRKVGGARVGGTRSVGGGLFGKALGNIAGAAVGHVPGGSGAAAGAARSAAVGGVHTTAGLASQVKDELSLDYRLESAAGARPVVSRAQKAKAKADGEDVLTPLVERAPRQ